MKSAFAGTASFQTGWQQATQLEVELQDGTAVGADTNIRVAYDSTTDEFVITNILGREMNISAATEPTAASTGQYFKTAAAVVQANKVTLFKLTQVLPPVC